MIRPCWSIGLLFLLFVDKKAIPPSYEGICDGRITVNLLALYE